MSSLVLLNNFVNLRANLDLVQYIVLSIQNFTSSGEGYMRISFSDAQGNKNQLIR